MTKSCIICGEEEQEGQLLLRAPCGNHWVCGDDVSRYFERAVQDESLYPPQCCTQVFFIEEWEKHIPFEVAWAFQLKEQGEYAVLPKFRVYCAERSCGSFLRSINHVVDEGGITYAICEAENCGRITCVNCKDLIQSGTQEHICKLDENEKKFKETARKEGYQECFICGSTVELAEACNHITCECGHNFCYICGEEWRGFHGCPQYGPAEYDDEGYNQNGYHKDTGLNRDGLDFRQQNMRDRGDPEDEEDGDTDEDEEDQNENQPDWDVLQHLGVEERQAIEALPHDQRDDILDVLRVQLFEERGIVFGDESANNNNNNDPDDMEVEQEPEQENEENWGGDERGDEGVEATQGDDSVIMTEMIDELDRINVEQQAGDFAW